MDGDDVRMVESGGGQGLSFEAVDAILIRREAGGEEFERYLAVQARVLCQVDLSHPARAERVKDFIRADGLTGEEFRSVFDHERAASSVVFAGCSATQIIGILSQNNATAVKSVDLSLLVVLSHLVIRLRRCTINSTVIHG